MVACSGQRLCKGEAGASVSSSFVHQVVGAHNRTVLCLGVQSRKPVLIPPELTDPSGGGQLTKQFQVAAEGDKRVGHGLSVRKASLRGLSAGFEG